MVYFLFADPHLLQLQHLLAAVHGELIIFADIGLLMTFFPCGQSTFMQCYSIALNKVLLHTLGCFMKGHQGLDAQ